MTPESKEAVDVILTEVDDKRIDDGLPILSVLVRHDDGSVSTAFWATVEKHKLRMDNETDADLIKRMTAMAHIGETQFRTIVHQHTVAFTYLDKLRLSGQINMYAAPYRLHVRFDMPQEKAKVYFNRWMNTFNDDDPPHVRAARAAGEV